MARLVHHSGRRAQWEGRVGKGSSGQPNPIIWVSIGELSTALNGWKHTVTAATALAIAMGKEERGEEGL